jgi:hypothetical protein
MRYLTITFVAFACMLFCSPVLAQKRCLRKFFRHEKGMSFGMRIGVGAFPLRVASWVIPASDSETVVARHVLQHVKHVKVYLLSSRSNNVAVSTEAISDLRNTLQTKEHFDPLIDVHNGSSVVYVLNKGKEDELGNVIMLVQSENNFVIVHLRTTLDMKYINGIVGQFAKM